MNELTKIAEALYALDPDGVRFARVIRGTIDQLLDGRRTGRWDYNTLYKTEKTHLGTLIEINLQKEFDFDDGLITDYNIAGIDVDCKYSKDLGGWELGPEMVGQYLLLVWASDIQSKWRVGLIKAESSLMRESSNRDRKRKLTNEAIDQIRWLWPNNEILAPNQLLHLEPEQTERIMGARTGNRISAQARVNQMCRELQGVIIRRVTTETVAFGQEDPMKRLRSNGGARGELRQEGITILGHQDNDPLIAEALGLRRPQKGQAIALRLRPVQDSDNKNLAAEIEGKLYVIAKPNESVPAAPFIPRKGDN